METTGTGSTEQRQSRDKTQQGKTLNYPIVVVDVDEPQSSIQVKRLRKGQGKLMTHVERIVNDLIEAGTVKSTAQPVVIVVREYSSSFLGFGGGDDDD
jgi:uncharacterized protein DUF6200